MRKSRSLPSFSRVKECGMRKSVSTCAIATHVLPLPTTLLEQIGFTSVIKVSHSTTNECIAMYRPTDFPAELLEIKIDPKDAEKALDIATCLATPSDVPEHEMEPMYIRTREARRRGVFDGLWKLKKTGL